MCTSEVLSAARHHRRRSSLTPGVLVRTSRFHVTRNASIIFVARGKREKRNRRRRPPAATDPTLPQTSHQAKCYMCRTCFVAFAEAAANRGRPAVRRGRPRAHDAAAAAPCWPPGVAFVLRVAAARDAWFLRASNGAKGLFRGCCVGVVAFMSAHGRREEGRGVAIRLFIGP